jgi:hypothetical protein
MIEIKMIETKKRVSKWHLENAALVEGLADRVRCIRQLVQIAVQNVKYRSNLLKEGLSTAKTVTENIGDIDLVRN